MALSKERMGELAMIVLAHKLENDGGVRLNPKEIKRELSNEAKKYGITPQEAAEFAMVFITKAYEKTMSELHSMITGKVEKQ
jgi:hypothetical protein